MRVYPRYTVVAEKLEALTSLGIANSRMKDYFDLWILACHSSFDGKTLQRAICNTFDRRKTTLQASAPFGLTEGFANDQQKQTQWQAFLRKNKLDALSLQEVITKLQNFLIPVLDAAHNNMLFEQQWVKDGPWFPCTTH